MRLACGRITEATAMVVAWVEIIAEEYDDAMPRV